MNLFEFFDSPKTGYQEVGDDNSTLQWKDSRKTKLTLRQIRKLRKMNDVRAYERAEHLKKVRKQYTPPAQPAM